MSVVLRAIGTRNHGCCKHRDVTAVFGLVGRASASRRQVAFWKVELLMSETKTYPAL